MSKSNLKNGRGMTRNALTDKQEMFCYEYVKDFNARRAAMATGTDPKQAASVGTQWLNPDRFPQVSLLINKILRERRDQCTIDAKRIVEELVKIALFNPKRMFTVGGVMIALHELPDEVAACISEFETWTKTMKNEETGEVESVPVLKVKFHSKMGALQELAKHIGYLSGLPAGDDKKSVWDQLLKAASEPVEDTVEARIAKALGHDPNLNEPKLPESELIDATDNAIDGEVDDGADQD